MSVRVKTHTVNVLRGCSICGMKIPRMVNGGPLSPRERVGVVETSHVPPASYRIGEHDSNERCQPAPANGEPPPWRTGPPDKPGIWEMRCENNDQQPELINVFLQDGELWVSDPLVGDYPLDRYHYQLTGISWRPVALKGMPETPCP